MTTSNLLPAAGEIEEELLGMILIDWDILNETTLTEEHFFYPANRTLFTYLKDLYAQGQPLELSILVEKLKADDNLDAVGGMPQIVGLMDISGTAAFWDSQEKILIERHKQREVYRTASQVANRASQLEPADELISELDQFVTRIDTSEDRNHAKALEAAARYATGDALVKTGIKVIDNAVGGFTRNDFTVVGARTSTGKSAFIHRIADSIAHTEEGPVTIFTPDQPIPEVLAMQAARECAVPLQVFRHGKATQEQKDAYLAAVANLQNGFLKRLDFRSGLLTIKHFERESVRAIRNGSVAIIVDTINRLSGPADKKHALIAEFGSLAKSLAAEYDVPVIGLAQVRRELDWEDRDPTRADLADAPGSLANDANMILLLNRNQAHRHEGIMQVIFDKVKADRAGHFVNVNWDDNFVMPHNGGGVKEVTQHLGQASMQL